MSKEISENKDVILGFTGDFNPSVWQRTHIKFIEKTKETVSLINESVDFSITNFECSIIDENFLSRPHKVSINIKNCSHIDEVGFNLFCLANNHIMDNGVYGLKCTESYLKDKGFLTVGAGDDINAANKPQQITINGKLICFINVTDATHYSASKKKPGVNPLNTKNLLKDIKIAKKNSDAVIVIIHSDIEFSKYPAPWRIKLSRKLVDVGATLVVQHHPHVLQGIESYKDSLIVYSLGNFVFPIHGNEYMEGRSNFPDRSIYLKVKLRFSSAIKIDYEAIPIFIDEDNSTVTPSNELANRITGYISETSEKIDDEKFIRKYYFNKCQVEMKRFVMDSIYTILNKGLISFIYYVKVHLSTKMHTNWIKGYFTLGKY